MGGGEFEGWPSTRLESWVKQSYHLSIIVTSFGLVFSLVWHMREIIVVEEVL
jgi:hypothetical protein